MYVAGYTFMRFWIERLRVDPATRLWGWRVNEVVSLVVFVIAVIYLLVSMRRAPAPAVLGADAVADAEPEPGERALASSPCPIASRPPTSPTSPAWPAWSSPPTSSSATRSSSTRCWSTSATSTRSTWPTWRR